MLLLAIGGHNSRDVNQLASTSLLIATHSKHDRFSLDQLQDSKYLKRWEQYLQLAVSAQTLSWLAVDKYKFGERH